MLAYCANILQISRSRHELGILRKEEVEAGGSGCDPDTDVETADTPRDGALLTHLDKKLGSLEREQKDLEEERLSMKNYLSMENLEHKALTETLLRQIGSFTAEHNPIDDVSER